MILSLNNSCCRVVYLPLFIALALVLICFKTDSRLDTATALTWSRIFLVQNCDMIGDIQVKKMDIGLTDDLFIRFRKTYLNGKQEYYSFNLKDFKDVTYLGTVAAGNLQLKTDTGEVIKQTYNDPQGNADDMTDIVNVPMKNIDNTKVDSLRMMLLFLKNSK